MSGDTNDSFKYLLTASSCFPSTAGRFKRPVFFIILNGGFAGRKIIILDIEEGFNKMIKMILKMFMPSPKTLAKMASKQIQAAINGC